MGRVNRFLCCLLALLMLSAVVSPMRVFADKPIEIKSSVGINFEGKCSEKKLVLKGYVDNRGSSFIAGACALKFDPSLLSIDPEKGVEAEGEFRMLKARSDNKSGDFSMEFAFVNEKGDRLESGDTQTKFVTLEFDLVKNGKIANVSEDSVKISENETYFIDIGTCFKDNGALTVYDLDDEDEDGDVNVKTLKNNGATSESTFNNPFNIKVTGVSVQPASVKLEPGKTQSLAATISPDNASNKGVTWSSSNPSVATVSALGIVTAVKPGETTITVTTNDGGKTATCKVTVEAPSGETSVTGISISPSSSTLTVGKTATLSCTISPSNATNKDVTWSSSDPSVATVSSSGVVTAVKAGTAVITVRSSDGGYTATANITVQNPPQKYIASLVPCAVTTVAGQKPSLPGYVSVVYSDGSTGTAPVSWSGIDASSYANPGSFVVLGTVSGVSTSAQCTVTVTQKKEVVPTPQPDPGPGTGDAARKNIAGAAVLLAACAVSSVCLGIKLRRSEKRGSGRHTAG